MIVCRKCEVAKPEERYGKTPAGNPRRLCKDCEYVQKKETRAKDPAKWQGQRRAAVIKHKYGITIQEYDALLTKQNGACAVCLNVVDYLLHVDHCHQTGRVRGLLCKDCNWGLGNLKDSVEILQSAITYLERW